VVGIAIVVVTLLAPEACSGRSRPVAASAGGKAIHKRASHRGAIARIVADLPIRRRTRGVDRFETRNISKAFGASGGARCNMQVSARDPGRHRPNGAGKTTFFNLLNGFILPDQGRFCSTTKHRGQKTLRDSRAGVGRTFQVSGHSGG
jgi:ATPase subunit of ABC transporter with duplicated ATPase domains